MNQKGDALPFIIIGLVCLALAVPVIMWLFPYADILMRIILVFLIFTIVKGYLGDGTPTLVVSAILIYFLAFKYAYIAATAYVLYILMGFSFLSVIVWGIGTRMH